MTNKNIDFDKLLSSGPKAYDTEVGNWWNSQSDNMAHQKAYHYIANKSIEQYKLKHGRAPKYILDYACGGGFLIKALLKVSPESVIIGLDASLKMLEKAMDFFPTGSVEIMGKSTQLFAGKGPQIRLFKTSLPDFTLPKNKADLVMFCFPNLIPDNSNLDVFNQNGYSHSKDNLIARALSEFREMDPEDEMELGTKDELFDEFMTGRVYSRNFTQLLKAGGFLARIEYANADRNDLTLLTRMRSEFIEGSGPEKVRNSQPRKFFSFVSNFYKKSKVIADVYHQTGDPEDNEGGYNLVLLQKL